MFFELRAALAENQGPARSVSICGFATLTCANANVICDNAITGRADKQGCPNNCHQAAWRRAQVAPAALSVAPSADTSASIAVTTATAAASGSVLDRCARTVASPVSITDLLGAHQPAQTVPVKAKQRR